MTSNKDNSGFGARLIWALATPFILVLIAFTVLGIFFLPAICIFLDNHSRTYTGAVFLAICLAALSVLLGLPALSVCVFIACATAAAYVFARVKSPFSTGLVGSAAGGVLGAVAMLGILGAAMGKPLNEIAANYFCTVLANAAQSGLTEPLNMFAAQLQAITQGSSTMGLLLSIPQTIVDMSVADKIAIIRPIFEQMIAAYIPAVAFVMGMLTGAAGYYLPVLAHDRMRTEEAAEGKAAFVPPFHTFKIPKYIVISILLLQIVASFGASGDNSSLDALYMASNMVFNTLMIFQALSLLSFFLTRKHVMSALQVLILVPTTGLFFWLLPWVGLFDALFDMRAMAIRVETIRAKGKQVFTQDGLNELRKMDLQTKNKKNEKDDGEDKKQ
jgi:hypothetical protein